jgi:hypothetical protein
LGDDCDGYYVVDVDQQMALVMLLRSETVWNSLLIFYREICQRFEMTQGHRNEVVDRVSTAPITGYLQLTNHADGGDYAHD